MFPVVSASWPGSGAAYRNRRAIPGCHPDGAYAHPDRTGIHRNVVRPQNDDDFAPCPDWRRTGYFRDAELRYDDRRPDADRDEQRKATQRIHPVAAPDGHPASETSMARQASASGPERGAWEHSDPASESAWTPASLRGAPAGMKRRRI